MFIYIDLASSGAGVNCAVMSGISKLISVLIYRFCPSSFVSPSVSWLGIFQLALLGGRGLLTLGAHNNPRRTSLLTTKYLRSTKKYSGHRLRLFILHSEFLDRFGRDENLDELVDLLPEKVRFDCGVL